MPQPRLNEVVKDALALNGFAGFFLRGSYIQGYRRVARISGKEMIIVFGTRTHVAR